MKKLLFLTMFVFFFSSVCFGAEPCGTYELIAEGGDELTEYTNIKVSDKVSTDIVSSADEVAVRDQSGKKSLPRETLLAAGVEAAAMSNTQSYDIPLSYGLPVNFNSGMTEFLNFNIKIPYVKREIGSASESGLGDIKLRASYFAKSEKLLFNITSLVKFDTGDVEDVEVLLGTGSTDFALYTNIEYYIDKLTLNAGAGYVLTGDYENIEYGDEYLVNAGAEYLITNKIIGKGTLLYNIHEEDEFSSTSKVPGIDTLDFTPSLTYVLPFGANIKAEAVIPVLTEWNGDCGGYDDPDRDPEFKLSFNHPF